MSKQAKIILTVAVILIAAGLIYSSNGKLPTNNPGEQVSQEKLKSISLSDHFKGSLNAPVKMIVYSDFECPFCAQFASTMKQIEDYFKDQVVIAYRHYPLPSHPLAEKAAEAAECAGAQGKFWEMHDKLFADNEANLLSEEQFIKDATDLGLDAAKFGQCLNSGQFAAKVAADKAGGDKAGVTGTPTSFINGYIYPGAYPFEDFTASDGTPEKGMKSIISELLK